MLKKYVLIVVFALGVSLLFNGCAESGTIKPEQESQVEGETLLAEEIISMEKRPQLGYRVPVIRPAIIVSQDGYEADREKRAIIRGQRMPEKYKVVNISTGKVVYEGKIESPVYNEEEREYIGYGDFTSLQTAGDYYIECDYLGKSFSFSVKEDYYVKAMEEAVGKLHLLAQSENPATNNRPSDEELIQKCRTISALLLSCELFSDNQVDGAIGEKNSVPDILDYAASQAAVLAKWQSSEDGSIGAATGWYCATLSKLSYTYQKYKSVDATRFLQAADKAWQYMDKNKDKFSDGERFFSAAELYRATGKSRYHTVVKELGKKLEPDIYNEALTYGAVTYASTRRAVNESLCNSYLIDMMEQAENISAASIKDDFMVGSRLQVGNTDIFFANTTNMVVVDYVITNEEYGSLIEDHQHYLMGRNELGLSYFDFEGCEKKADNFLGEEAVYLAKYIMILSEIMDR